MGAIVDGISPGGGHLSRCGMDRYSSAAIGVVHLKDIVKVGIRERFDEMLTSIRTVMITGDNPATAKAILHRRPASSTSAEAMPGDACAHQARTAGRSAGRHDG